MAAWQEEPQVGHSVWSDHRNGVITRIDYEGREVYVDYYTKGRDIHSLDDLIGCFDERLNQWIIVSI